MSQAFITGRKTVAVAGTRERLSAVPLQGPFIEIQALASNAGVIVLGDENVVAAIGTRQGIALSPGEARGYSWPDLYDLWLDATVNGDGVSYLIKRA
jgi:hypothetical protein